jgi:hypothetical protein
MELFFAAFSRSGRGLNHVKSGLNIYITNNKLHEELR